MIDLFNENRICRMPPNADVDYEYITIDILQVPPIHCCSEDQGRFLQCYQTRARCGRYRSIYIRRDRTISITCNEAASNSSTMFFRLVRDLNIYVLLLHQTMKRANLTLNWNAVVLNAHFCLALE